MFTQGQTENQEGNFIQNACVRCTVHMLFVTLCPKNTILLFLE